MTTPKHLEIGSAQPESAWRDFRDQLTDAQAASMTRREELFGHQPGYLDLLAMQAAEHAQKNHRDAERFGHVPVPAGAHTVEHWELDDITGGWRREWVGRSRQRHGIDVAVEGTQTADGEVRGILTVTAPAYGVVLTCHDARQLAAQLAEAADELERIITASQ